VTSPDDLQAIFLTVCPSSQQLTTPAYRLSYSTHHHTRILPRGTQIFMPHTHTHRHRPAATGLNAHMTVTHTRGICCTLLSAHNSAVTDTTQRLL